MKQSNLKKLKDSLKSFELDLFENYSEYYNLQDLFESIKDKLSTDEVSHILKLTESLDNAKEVVRIMDEKLNNRKSTKQLNESLMQKTKAISSGLIYDEFASVSDNTTVQEPVEHRRMLSEEINHVDKANFDAMDDGIKYFNIRALYESVKVKMSNEEKAELWNMIKNTVDDDYNYKAIYSFLIGKER